MQQSEVPISFSFPPANRQTAVLNCAWYLLAAKEFPVPRSRAGSDGSSEHSQALQKTWHFIHEQCASAASVSPRLSFANLDSRL